MAWTCNFCQKFNEKEKKNCTKCSKWRGTKPEPTITREMIHDLRCGDGNCIFAMPELPKGMITNGGCQCLKDIKYSDLRLKIQKLAQAYKETK